MKKILLAAITLFCVNGIYAQGTWTRIADFGGAIRRDAVAFSIGEKGYLGTGRDKNFTLRNDFWEYDPANFGGVPRYRAVGFSIGKNGYVGTGYGNEGLKKDFWEYDPVTNKWTQKANFGGTARSSAQGFSIGTKGYIGTGTDLNYPNADTRDFWEYNPATNKWTKKADFGGDIRAHATAFSIGNKGYLGIGDWVDYDGFEYDIKNDFWEYNPSTNKWTRKADFAGGDWWAAPGFSIDGKGYVGTGYDGIGDSRSAFWEYNPGTNKWTKRANFGGGARTFAVSFSVGGKGYIGMGGNFSGNKKDFWQYCPAAMVADEQVISSDASVATTGVATTGLLCYPNPSRGSISVQYNIDISQAVQFAVRDIQGRIVLRKTELVEKGINTRHLNLSNLSSGTYFLQLTNGQQKRITQIVINK